MFSFSLAGFCEVLILPRFQNQVPFNAAASPGFLEGSHPSLIVKINVFFSPRFFSTLLFFVSFSFVIFSLGKLPFVKLIHHWHCSTTLPPSPLSMVRLSHFLGKLKNPWPHTLKHNTLHPSGLSHWLGEAQQMARLRANSHNPKCNSHKIKHTTPCPMPLAPQQASSTNGRQDKG